MSEWFSILFICIFLAGALTLLASEWQNGTASSSKSAARSGTERNKPLVFTEAIPLEDVKGRFDRFAMGKDRLFVSALGNNAVEIIHIGGRILEHTDHRCALIQGFGFSPRQTNCLWLVASGAGKVYIYDARSFEQIGAVAFEGGADHMRYDAATKRVDVGCGDDEKTGAIAMIDATTNERLDEEYKLGCEPESFSIGKIWVEYLCEGA